MIGFRPSAVNRQPVYGERTAGKVGYTERDEHGREWFQDRHGRRIARVTKWRPHQAPQPSGSNLSGMYDPSLGR